MNNDIKISTIKILCLITQDIDIYCQETLIDYFLTKKNVSLTIAIFASKKNSFSKEIYEYIKNKKWKITLFTKSLLDKHESMFIFSSDPEFDYFEMIVEKKHKIFFIPYGCSISGEPYSSYLQYNNKVHNYAWRIITISEHHRSLYKKNCKNYTDDKILILKKHPKFDFVLSKGENFIRKDTTFTIFWCIHYSIRKSIFCDRQFSTFFQYAEIILFFIKRYNVKIIISPHPALQSRHNEDRDYYVIMSKFSKLKNVEILEGADFHCNRFFNSDVMITDLSTTALDYSVTKKPIISMFGDNSAHLNTFGENFFNNMTYKVYSPTQLVERLIALMHNKDEHSNHREKYVNCDNGLFNINDSIEDIIYKELEKADSN